MRPLRHRPHSAMFDGIEVEVIHVPPIIIIVTMRWTAKLSALRVLLSIPDRKPLRHESMLLGFIHRSHREIGDVHATFTIGIFHCSAG